MALARKVTVESAKSAPMSAPEIKAIAHAAIEEPVASAPHAAEKAPTSR